MNYTNRKVLVTGACGMTGLALTRRLFELGARVRATVFRREPDLRWDGVEYMRADLTQTEDCVRAVEGMECVFHLAAITAGSGLATRDPVGLTTSNMVLHARLLEAAYREGVDKVLWLSSTTAYPDTAGRPVREEELLEGDPHDAYFSVGWMYRYTEILCRMYSSKIAQPICVQVLRPTNIYGPHDNFSWESSHVLPALMRKVVERQNPIEVWGTGEEIRDLVFCQDVAEACLSILDQSGGYDPVNIGLGKGYSVKDMLRLLCEADGYRDVRIVFNSKKPSVIAKRLVDTGKARTRYGFVAKTDLPEGIEKTLRWYKESVSLAHR